MIDRSNNTINVAKMTDLLLIKQSSNVISSTSTCALVAAILGRNVAQIAGLLWRMPLFPPKRYRSGVALAMRLRLSGSLPIRAIFSVSHI